MAKIRRRTRRKGAKKRRTRRRLIGAALPRGNGNNNIRLHYVPAQPLGDAPMNNEPPGEILPELYQLVEAGNVEGVDDYLQAAANPIEELNMEAGIEHMSPLMRAASNCNLEMVHLLLSYGADPNYVNGEGDNETALMYALVAPGGITPDIGAIVDALLTNAQRLDINGDFVPVNVDPNIIGISGNASLDVIDNAIAEAATPTMLAIRANLIAHGAVYANQQ
jgi:hypothetical protein